MEGDKLHFVIAFLIGVIIFNIAITIYYKEELKKEKVIEKHVEQLKKINNILRKQKHEALNQIQIINGLIELKEFEEVKKYINPLFEEINIINKGKITESSLLNAFFTQELIKAESKNISFDLEIDSIIKDIKISEFQICAIFKEVLDNIYKKLNLVQERKIKIQIKEDKKYNMIIMHFQDNGEKIPEVIFSTINIQKITRKYKNALKNGYSLDKTFKILNPILGEVKFKYNEGNIIEIRIPKII